MMAMTSTSRLVPLVLAAAVLASGCNSAWFRRASSVAGQEAAYGALAGYLARAGVRSADHFVDAVRLVVARRDYAAGAAAFSVALAEHNTVAAEKLSSPQVIALLRQAQPVVNRASRRVGSSLAGFCDYLATH
jgi:hypothetical protein